MPVLRGETILVLSYGRWKDRHLNAGRIVSRINRNNRIVFVEVPERYYACRRERGWPGYLRRFVPRPPVRIDDRTAVIESPPMLPELVSVISRFRHDEVALRSIRLSKWWQRVVIRRQLAALRLRPSIVLAFQAFDLLSLGRFGEKLSVYRTYDEIQHFQGNLGIARVIEDLERRHMRNADLVLCSSVSQYERRKDHHPGVHLLPNGVDFKLFRRPCAPPEELESIPRPRLGYVGTIDYRMDFDLLDRIASRHPEWSLVLAGPCRPDRRVALRHLDRLPNVHVLGPRPVDRVPGILGGIDVGLIPFLVTPSTNSMYFYKLHEYLALGKPVVSPDLFELRPFRPVVHLAADRDGFEEMIATALATDDREARQARIEVARENGWDARIEAMSGLLMSRLVS
jgi:glycosyltransferase involved in cell wall biosynthesis